MLNYDFQQACGYEYTSKLQRMFQDIGVSKDLVERYRTYCEQRKLYDIGIRIWIVSYHAASS